jgi:hypothetical protein
LRKDQELEGNSRGNEVSSNDAEANDNEPENGTMPEDEMASR